MLNLENSVILHEASKSKHKAHIVLQVLIFIAIFLISSIVSGLLVGVPLGFAVVKGIDPALFVSGDMLSIMEAVNQTMRNLPEWIVVLNLFTTAITTGCAFIYCRAIEGRSFASMGLGKKGVFKKYGRGYLVGIVMIAAAVGLSALFGGTRFTGFNSSVSWLYIALFFVGFLIQGMSEEVMMRGYFMVSCANKVSVALAVGISSIAFSALHLANKGITPLAFVNLALFGAFAAVYMLRTDDLWGVCALHASWNFFQGHFFGISVSGGAVGSSVFGTAFNQGKELISGGSFGIEGGVCTTIVLLAAIALVLFLPQKPRPALPQEELDGGGEHNPKEAMPVYIQK